MNPEARELRKKVENLRSDLQHAEGQLKRYVAQCRPHAWGEAVYDPIYTKAYTIPGDLPGTMGVDWRGPVDVPARTEDRWRRECIRCGSTEYASGVQETITRTVPRWPGEEK